MAQGNYVPISGVNANWGEGLSSALANLSKTYASQAEAEKERARLAAADAESKRRYEQNRADIAARNAITDARNKAADDYTKTLQDRQTEQYNLETDMRNWVKDFGSKYNEDDIRKFKALNVFDNVTEDTLKGEQGRKILDAIPVYQEDIDNFYTTKYLDKFGQHLDVKTIRPYYSDISSLAGLQSAEDKKAELDRDWDKESRDFQLNAAGKLVPKSSYDRYDAEGSYLGTANAKGTGTSGSRSAPKSYAEILVNPLVKGYEENSNWNPLQSERQQAQKVATTVLEALQTKGIEATPAEAEVVTKKTLDVLRNGGNLSSINNSNKLAITTAKDVLNEYRANRTAQVATGVNPGREILERFAKGEGIQSYAPTDIRSTRRKAAQKTINELLGILPPPTPKPAADVSTTSNATEKDILANIGVGTTDNKVQPNNNQTVRKDNAATTAEDKEALEELRRLLMLETINSNQKAQDSVVLPQDFYYLKTFK